jgi:type I restriction enzyme, S subunit
VKAGWVVRRLSEVTTKIGSGATPRGGNVSYKQEGLSLIRSLNVHDLNFRKKDLALIDEIQAEALSNVVVQPRDVLLNITGASIARCTVVPDEVLPARVNQHVSIIRPVPQEVDSNFLAYLLVSKDVKDRLLGIGDEGGSTRQALTKAQLQEFSLPLPPLEEQQRIVAVLDEAFEGLARARAHAEANLQNARELFDRAAFELFEGLRREHTTLALRDLAEKITKGSSPKWQGISYVEEPGVLFVTSENVGKNEIDLTKKKYVEEEFNEKDRKSILAKGDVLTNIVGASIGRTAVFDLDEVANINQAVCMIRCDPIRLNNYYLSFLLNSPYFKAQLHAGEVNMARANLSLTFFRELQVPVPPMSKQEETVQAIEALRHQTSALELDYQSKLQDLDDLRQSLLQKAFAGELT